MSDETTSIRSDSVDASELQKFARCFTKDWRSKSDSFGMIAYKYIERLTPERKAGLVREYQSFLNDSSGDTDESLLQRWYDLGAEVWDFDVTLRPTLSDFYWIMNPDAPEFQNPVAGPVAGSGFVIIGLRPRRPGGEE